VLPRITSNVSVFPTEPNANPLHDWLTSLAALPNRVPNDVLVLPAHNAPFIGLHERIGELIDSHRRGLLGMATGEAVAHLNYLLEQRRATRELDEAGVWWWRNNPMSAVDSKE
jgi:hypothetical protein